MVSYDNIFADIRFGPKDVIPVRVLRCFHSSSLSIDVFAEEIDENLEFRYFCIAMASSLRSDDQIRRTSPTDRCLWCAMTSSTSKVKSIYGFTEQNAESIRRLPRRLPKATDFAKSFLSDHSILTSTRFAIRTEGKAYTH